MDQIRTDYKNILNKVQENDDGQINFLKYNMQKFGQIIDQLGKGIRQKGDELGDAAEIVNSTTDIKIFIEHHKSANMVVNKERFLHYEENQKLHPQHKRSGSVASPFTTNTGAGFKMSQEGRTQLVIVNDYMTSAVSHAEPNSATLTGTKEKLGSAPAASEKRHTMVQPSLTHL